MPKFNMVSLNVDHRALPSQRLINAALGGDVDAVSDCLALGSGIVDVNFIGTVNLRVKCVETVPREEQADETEVEYRDFVTDVTPLFAAAHSGQIEIVRKLLSAGADVNQELFRGFAATAAAREGHCAVLDMLLKAGSSKSACEHALLEACLCDQSKAAELLICSEMTGPDVAQHALVSASSRGFFDVASMLIKNGVDINCMDRVLLRSVKPALHANVDCTPLVAAIVSRQVSMVKYLLEAGAKTDNQFKLGAWSWDIFSNEELRVGACLGEPYNEVWCAVEYYEITGQILELLLQNHKSSPQSQQQGRNLLCHAILCQNPDTVSVLLSSGADVEFPITTKKGHESYPLHLAARLGCLPILRQLIARGCQINSRTEIGDTALMVAARADQEDCFLELIVSGADLGLVNNNKESAMQLAKRSVFGSSIANILHEAAISGKIICSKNLQIFSLLHFVAGTGDMELLQIILPQTIKDINKHDGLGLTPILVAVKARHFEIFRLLIINGADISMTSKDDHSLLSLLKDTRYADDRIRFLQILLDAVLSHELRGSSEFKPLHFAAQIGDQSAITKLLQLGFLINSLDENGYSPLMLASKEGHACPCKLLLQKGSDLAITSDDGETALSLARKNHKGKTAEGVIFDHMARSHVLAGEELQKHTRDGKGSLHLKFVRMLKSGSLTWGKSSRRNIVCKEAVVGPSPKFLKNTCKGILDLNGVIFRVVTDTGREVHFEASSDTDVKLWVRGVNLIVKEASLGSHQNANLLMNSGIS